MNKRSLALLCGAGAGVLLVTALLLALTAGAATGPTAKPKPHGVPAPFGSVEFFITEAMLSATTLINDPVDKVPMPAVNPHKFSDAYDCTCKPGAKSITVQQDMFLPDAITVHQGDVVALRIFDLEGHHVLTLYDPTGNKLFTKFKNFAGNEYLKIFTANQLGIYRLVCETHDPTMKLNITVLRKGA
jgi:plastocyanin